VLRAPGGAFLHPSFAAGEEVAVSSSRFGRDLPFVRNWSADGLCRRYGLQVSP
jgi:hypothetical protein